MKPWHRLCSIKVAFEVNCYRHHRGGSRWSILTCRRQMPCAGSECFRTDPTRVLQRVTQADHAGWNHSSRQAQQEEPMYVEQVGHANQDCIRLERSTTVYRSYIYHIDHTDHLDQYHEVGIDHLPERGVQHSSWEMSRQTKQDKNNNQTTKQTNKQTTNTYVVHSLTSTTPQ